MIRSRGFSFVFVYLLYSPLFAITVTPGVPSSSVPDRVVPSSSPPTFPSNPLAPRIPSPDTAFPTLPEANQDSRLSRTESLLEPKTSSAVRTASGSEEKMDGSTKPIPGIRPKRSRIGFLISSAVGGLWNYSYITDEAAGTGTLTRVSEAQLLFDAGIAVYALDACQLSSNAACVDLLVRLQIGGGYEFERAMATFSGLLGVEADIYPSSKRRVAFTMKIALGYEHIFAPDLLTVQEPTIPQPFRLDPNHTDALVLAASPGILIHLGDLTKGLRYALSVDLRGYFSGGQFGFLIPIEFRYRF